MQASSADKAHEEKTKAKSVEPAVAETERRLLIDDLSRLVVRQHRRLQSEVNAPTPAVTSSATDV